MKPTKNLKLPQFNTTEGKGLYSALNKAFRRIDNAFGGEGVVQPELQNPTIPKNLTLKATALPTWSNKSLRNGIWSVSNTAASTLTISAGTVVSTGLDLAKNQLYSVVLMGENLEENTIKVNTTGKSITFTANVEIPANDTLYILVMEEKM